MFAGHGDPGDYWNPPNNYFARATPGITPSESK
jgi:hypothetical protein